jgi:RNA polymerase sigma-70 factor (ECF subfamily)
MADRESGPDLLLADLQQGRRRFLALVGEIRPELHRYCARMTGSVTAGEDVVQESLARAYYALSELEEWPDLRPWLFRIAHRRALDHLRSYERRMSRPLDEVEETAADAGADPEQALAREEVVNAAVSRFVELPPAQRSCVILKDVLGHSLEETAALLELSVPAVKAALHRGRAGLRQRNAAAAAVTAASPAEPSPAARRPSPAVLRYAALFNARDWDGVRAMLADDVRLDLVSRVRRSGRRAVGNYFSNYDRMHDWHLAPAWLEGREVLAVLPAPNEARAAYFIELTVAAAGADGPPIVSIRDFRYVRYVAAEADLQLAPPAAAP